MGCFGNAPMDQTDYPPRPMLPSKWDIVWLISGIIFHFVDLGTDVNVAAHYYRRHEIYFVYATIIIVTMPSIIMALVSFSMYRTDREDETSKNWSKDMKLRLILLVLQLAPVIRYYDSLRYACKSRVAARNKNKEEQERYYKLMLKEDADVALLRVFKSFLEAAPQLVLQISYLLKSYYQMKESDTEYTEFQVVYTYLSAGTSFAGMAYCLMTYQKSVRYVQENKDNINWKGSIFLFLWHFCVTISRILMLSAMMHISWMYAMISVVVHWIIMTITLLVFESHDFCTSTRSIQHQKQKACEKFANFLFSAVLGIVYIFTYITPGEGGTRLRYTGFYLTCFFQNITGAVIWYLYADISWLSILVSVMCVLPFILGCLFMVIYHWKFHPRKYVPPSIMLRRRQIEVPEGTHLAGTPSPKMRVESNDLQNGSIPHGNGQGDSEMQTNTTDCDQRIIV